MATLNRGNSITDWLCAWADRRALRRDAIACHSMVVPQRRSRRPEVEALRSQRRVPGLVVDGEVICDSRRIVEDPEGRRSAGGVSEATR
jgi:hypothetical protein